MNAKVKMTIRIIFGVFCLFFGLNKFFGFMEFPPIPGDGGVLMDIYAKSGFLKIIGVLEILGGIALIVNKFVPLSLTILIAIMFNAFLFHALHSPEHIMGALLGMILGAVLVFAYKSRFANLLKA